MLTTAKSDVEQVCNLMRENKVIICMNEAKINRFLEKQSVAKPNLENKMRNPIMDKIEYLRNNYNHQGHVEMAYYLHRLSNKFNVKTIEGILAKINR